MAAGGKGGAAGGGDDGGGLGLLYGIGILCVILWLVYRSYHDEVVYAVFYMRYYELKFIGLFTSRYDNITLWVETANLDRVTFDQLKILSFVVGRALTLPLSLIAVILMGVIYFFHPDSTYRAIENMQSLGERLKETFPCIEVVQRLDLANVPIDKGPWAMAESPVEFSMRHKLISRDVETRKIVLDKERTKMIFSRQLGQRWLGVDALQDYERALFAIFALFIHYKRDEAEALAEQICASATQEAIQSGKLDFAGVPAVIKKYGQSDLVNSIVSRHAYVLSVFVAMLTGARSSGIVANSLFLWVKPIDRILWYTINNVGRKAVFTETAGIHAHWLAESKLSIPIEQPMVDECVNALEEAIAMRIVKEI